MVTFVATLTGKQQPKQSARAKKKQDETGLEIACFRHSVVQAAVRQEIYIIRYPHYLHTRVLLPKQVKFLWEDMICLHWLWALPNTPEAYVDALDIVPASCLSCMENHTPGIVRYSLTVRNT